MTIFPAYVISDWMLTRPTTDLSHLAVSLAPANSHLRTCCALDDAHHCVQSSCTAYAVIYVQSNQEARRASLHLGIIRTPIISMDDVFKCRNALFTKCIV
jgi:hypothetical protein